MMKGTGTTMTLRKRMIVARSARAVQTAPWLGYWPIQIQTVPPQSHRALQAALQIPSPGYGIEVNPALHQRPYLCTDTVQCTAAIVIRTSHRHKHLQPCHLSHLHFAVGGLSVKPRSHMKQRHVTVGSAVVVTRRM